MSAEASNVRSSVPSYTAKQLECLGMLGAHILTVLALSARQTTLKYPEKPRVLLLDLDGKLC